MTIKNLAIAFGAAILGNYVAEKFILKSGPDDTSGFIDVSPGFGLDDAARAGCIVGVGFLAHKFLG